MKIALLFPRQVSRYVGMGKALWEASPDVRKRFQAGPNRLGTAHSVHRQCRCVPDPSA